MKKAFRIMLHPIVLHAVVITIIVLITSNLIRLYFEPSPPPREYRIEELTIIFDRFHIPGKEKIDAKTKFVVCGTNDTTLIRDLAELDGVPIVELEKKMRQGKLLGEKEKLLEVMGNDNERVLKTLRMTHQQLATQLQALIAISVLQKRREVIDKGTMFIYQGRRFRVDRSALRDHDRPFNVFVDGLSTVEHVVHTIHNLDAGTSLDCTVSLALAIEGYGFYGGPSCTCRVDPRKIVEVFDFLEPKVPAGTPK